LINLITQKPPSWAVLIALQRFKLWASSPRLSAFLRKQFWGQHMWQIGYFCCTTGTVTEQTVRDYIAEQGKKEEDEDRTFLVLG
jgi:putative transposase